MLYTLAERVNVYGRVTQDMEIMRVCLLLTGSVQGTKKAVATNLGVWTQNANDAYNEFTETKPGLDDCEEKLMFFVKAIRAIDSIPVDVNIGATTNEIHCRPAHFRV